MVPCAAVAQVPMPEPLRTAGDRPIDIQHIRLDLQIDLPKKTLDGQATLKVRALRPLSSFALDAVDFEVQSVNLAEAGDRLRPLSFSHDGKKLAIDLDPAWPEGREATLRIGYRVRNPKDGLYFFGPTAEEPDVPLTAWTQGEPVANRYWFPCLDQPNQRQTTELVVTVPAGFDVLSNGKLLEQHTNGDRTATFHWMQDKPHVSYLVTLVVGQFDVGREEWDRIPVLYYVPKGHKDDIPRTFGKTRDMLGFFSKRFGIHYPWDKYAQVVVEQFTMGGMENTSATTLTEWALHDERSLLDGNAEGLIAHEMAHQWWGDLVTCRDWAHLWLNEGFASYAEALWDEQARGADEYAYNMFQKAGRAIGGGKHRPVVDHRYPTAWSMFDGRAYPKGAWLLHMLRQRLGDDAFFRSLQAYGEQHRLKCAETSDFRRTLERVTGRDLERFFYDWAERPGNPEIHVTTEYLADAHQAKVTVKQTQAGEAFHFPLTISFRCPPESRLQTFEQSITEKEHTFYLSLPTRPTMVVVDPAQAVLAEIKEEKGHDLWLAELREAPSIPARIRAAKHLAASKAAADLEALAAALANERFWGVQVEIAEALGDAGGDVSRDALIQGTKAADARVRRACVDQLGKYRHDAKVIGVVRGILQAGDRSYAVEAAALAAYAKLGPTDTVAVLMPWLAKPSFHESLRCAALNGMAEAEDPAVLDTLLTWSKRGKPRECRTTAFHALTRLAKTGLLNEDQRKQIVAALSSCLEHEGPRVRTSAVEALQQMGASAASAVAALTEMSLHDPSEGTRAAAKRAIEEIHKNAPVPVEVGRLRDELDRLKREQEQLRERLSKYERLERKGKTGTKP